MAIVTDIKKKKDTYNAAQNGQGTYQSQLAQASNGNTDTKIPGTISGAPTQSNLTMTGGGANQNPPAGTGINQQTQSGAYGRPPVTVGANGQMQTGAAGSGGNGLSGVSQATQQQLSQYQNYTPGQQVSAAQQQLDAILGSKPGEYQSRYGDQIDAMMGKVTGDRDPFSYNFNDDELFKYYADLYTQQGKQAAMDTQAQAAALTGGYGNSWAESAGNQAYQQYLTQLYDRGMDLRDRAYQQYQDEQADLFNRMNVLQNAENLDYGRYRDVLSDWRNDVDYQTGRADTAYNQDYNQFLNGQNFWQNMANMENQDYWTGQNFQQNADQFAQNMQYNWAGLQQNQAQFDAQMAQNAQQFAAQQANNQQQQAWSYIQAILANGQMPSADLLALAGLTQADVQAMIAQQAAAGGGGGGNGGNGGQTQNQQAQNIANGAGNILNTMGNTLAAQQAVNWWNNWVNNNYQKPNQDKN